MLCWDWSWESPSRKRSTGSWMPWEHEAASGVVAARLRFPQRDQTGPAPPPAASLHRTTMTAEHPGSVPEAGHTLILYDGVCGLCNRLVAFLLRHDKRDRFRFVPLQSDLAHTMLRRYGLSTHDFDTVVVVADFDGGSARVLTRADAVLWCVRQLGGVARLFAVVGVFLPCMREAAYRLIARCRYRIFGKSDTCTLPNPRDRHKFLA